MAGRARIRAFGWYRSVSGSIHLAGEEAVQCVRRASDILRAMAKSEANHAALFLDAKPARSILVSQKISGVGSPHSAR
jgi:hypothetical protein